MTQTASVAVTERVLGDVSPYIYGYDVEHVGREVNGGLWDVGERRLRPEVLEPVKALAPTLIRWPGSIHCSRYDWRDGVGEERRAYARVAYGDMAENFFAAGGWTPPGMTDEEFVNAVGGPDPNTFGTDELLALCAEIGAEPLLAANPNLGPEVAAEWVRYCNRRPESPRRVAWWTVAYEPWAPYEDGEFASGTEFGELFLTFVAAMRAVDPEIRFVVGGAPWPDFVEGLPEGSDLSVVGGKLDNWNRELVRVVGADIEAISMHYTFPGALGRLIKDTPSDLQQVATGGDALGPMLDKTLAEVRATPGGERLGLQLLEWGWQVHSDELLETNHRLGDALLLAGCWNRMIERPEAMRLATMNHLVSALSSIQTRGDDVFTTALHLVGSLYRETTRRSARAVEVRSPTLHVPRIEDVGNAMHVMEAAAIDREAPVLDAAATSDERGLTVFIANRSLGEPLTVTVSGLSGDGVAELRRLDGPSPYARNEVGEEVLSVVSEQVPFGDGTLEVTLPPATVAAVLAP